MPCHRYKVGQTVVALSGGRDALIPAVLLDDRSRPNLVVGRHIVQSLEWTVYRRWVPPALRPSQASKGWAATPDSGRPDVPAVGFR
jgi:hypothetical protein